MNASKKNIICIEGLDCVGKSTYLEETKKTILRCNNPILSTMNDTSNIIFEHFPTDNSEARRIRKTETNIDEVKLQELMLQDIVERVDKFFNQDKETTMICDRFLFSNFIYSFNMSLTDFMINLNSYWSQYNLPMYDVFARNNLTTILMEIPEDIRMKRMFMNRSESERDSNENEVYQQQLYDRYSYFMKNMSKELKDTFNIKLFYPKCKDKSII